MYNDLIGKKINFLFGSGASMPYISTLDLGNGFSYEYYLTNSDLENKYKSNEKNKSKKKSANYKSIVLSHYYENIIKKSLLDETVLNGDTEKENYELTLKYYKNFLEKTIKLIHEFPKNSNKTINIFTTNYDLFFEKSVDHIFQDGDKVFEFSDGGSGTITRTFSLKNYDKKIYSTGIFGKIQNQIPTLNLYKIHGSISWEKSSDGNININYNKKLLDCANYEIFFDPKEKLDIILDKYFDDKPLRKFDKFYSEIAIVNPTKKKFEETVFQEAYYHIIRQMSYELEKENSILIVFGFSFADEHITEIIKRSLNNSGLKIFIYCYNAESRKSIEKKLPNTRNQIEYVVPEDEGCIKFDNFIEKLFGNKETRPNE